MKTLANLLNQYVCEQGWQFTANELKNALIVCLALSMLLLAASAVG